jgi:predicted CXXCH cytochrome family protein
VKSASAFVLLSLLLAFASRAQTVFDPHGDPQTGVLRAGFDPDLRGQCVQCHPTHGEEGSSPKEILLYDDNDNAFCFNCHEEQPNNYPLMEIDRMPETAADAGYFEANVGGERIVGVHRRGRWPGRRVYEESATAPNGHLYSPHAQDPDMPRFNEHNEGRCVTCHDPHGTENPFDLLVGAYRGIGGHETDQPPVQYGFCLDCHSSEGPAGMDLENTFIRDYYDSGLNGDSAGHAIQFNSDIALSWPSHIQRGDKLACYDCHNPHGSQGYNGADPNAFLISDERPEWSGLTDTLNDPVQARRFCLGCHIPSDGVPGSQSVQGIVMNTLPQSPQHHGSTATKSCTDCHGRDYGGPTAANVHNPSSTAGSDPWGP